MAENNPGRDLARIRWAKRLEREFTCPRCGKVFSSAGRAIYCGDSCRQMAYHARKRQRMDSARARKPGDD